jgi:hypothetical protein
MIVDFLPHASGGLDFTIVGKGIVLHGRGEEMKKDVFIARRTKL